MIGHAMKFAAFKVIEIAAAWIVVCWAAILGNVINIRVFDDLCGFWENVLVGIGSVFVVFIACVFAFLISLALMKWIIINWEWTEDN